VQGPRKGFEILEMKEGGTGDEWVAGVKERLKDGLIDEGWRD